MRIAYVTAGAANMYCGSCLHDNTLVTALLAQGHDALLIPTYTPIRTDEPNVSQRRVFFGGINVFLQQKSALFRHTPWLLDRLLDAPGLLRWVTARFGFKTEAELLGELTISMLKGEHGNQRKEVAKLARWLATDVKPEVINLTNAIISGLVHEVKRHVGAPVLCTLQGDDVFLESLPDAYRTRALQLIREHCREFDGFIATSVYYADFMADYFSIPRERIDVIYPGLNLLQQYDSRPSSNGPPYTIGYFARICPEKGLHVLVEAFRILRKTAGSVPCRLHVSGWLGENHRPYLEGLRQSLQQNGLEKDFSYTESPDHSSKVKFLRSLDVLSVPTTYREPKGLYILEALAAGVPVVQPRHGSFPELIEATGGGLLVNPNDPEDLAHTLGKLLVDVVHREGLGRKGREVVRQRFTAERMARETALVYRKYL
ncbi:MAG TPA: glycosyltransferase family 4 protein [Gemmataceae bacterium]|nr:glycosyltransferase family 4 protein [Gemmataceae bacterium]